MKAFISHSRKDKAFIDTLIQALKTKKVDVWIDTESLRGGDDITKTIKKALLEIDYFIIVLSKNSVISEWVNFELSTTLVNEISLERKIVVPVLIDNCELPDSIKNRYYIDFRNSFAEGFKNLMKTLNQKPKKFKNTDRKKLTLHDFSNHVESLQLAYQKGNLSLFCGAGISFESGIPSWKNLLKSLLSEVYSYDASTPINDLDAKLANIFQQQINLSPLIIAKYIKLWLGNNFLETTRKILYKNLKSGNKTIAAISELSRPRRGKKPLHSIVTFNFDSLIEEQFEKDKVEYKSIHKEGERVSENEIPIYHPHGYLPQKGKITLDNNIVFSEDAYHLHFTDSFNWSNLIQLNQLNNNTCLFIGISLTDPNMRRIIDVTARKTGYQDKNHYIIKKKYDSSSLFQNAENTQEEAAIIQIVESIEEADANKMGFNVIWIEEYTEIPKLLQEIGK